MTTTTWIIAGATLTATHFLVALLAYFITRRRTIDYWVNSVNNYAVYVKRLPKMKFHVEMKYMTTTDFIDLKNNNYQEF